MEWQHFKDIWALAVPVMTLVVSAWWNRRNQEADQQRIRTEQSIEAQRQARQVKYEELKTALVSFMSSNLVFPATRELHENDSTWQIAKENIATGNRLATSVFLVSIMGSDELAHAAHNLFNKTNELADMPAAYEQNETAKEKWRERAHLAWSSAFDDFETKARNYLAKLDGMGVCK